MDSEELRKLSHRIVIDAMSLLYELLNSSDSTHITGRGYGGDYTYLVDKQVEELIIDYLKHERLKARIVSEEVGVVNLFDNPDLAVLIDPVDGSLNYVSKIPFVSVSIVFYDMSRPYIGEALAGAVGNVFLKEVYSFNKQSVFIDHRVINSIGEMSVKGLVSLYSEDPLFIGCLKSCLDRQFNMSVKFRTMGSASLESIYSAIGRIDLFIHNTGRLRNLDVAGGVEIAKRLGVHFSDLHGNALIKRTDGVERIESIIIGFKGVDVLDCLKKTCLKREYSRNVS